MRQNKQYQSVAQYHTHQLEFIPGLSKRTKIVSLNFERNENYSINKKVITYRIRKNKIKKTKKGREQYIMNYLKNLNKNRNTLKRKKKIHIL